MKKIRDIVTVNTVSINQALNARSERENPQRLLQESVQAAEKANKRAILAEHKAETLWLENVWLKEQFEAAKVGSVT